MMDLSKLLRPHIKNIKPYSSARDDYSGQGEVFLDANENAMGSTAGDNYHRYPDPHQRRIKNRLSEIKNIDPSRIFVGNGSDEPIDLIIRAFCRPGIDHVITTPPTYGMYGVSAAINDVQNREIPLRENFELDHRKLLASSSEFSKIVFLCSPNNPTGNLLKKEHVLEVIRGFNGLVVLDEAYIDFTNSDGMLNELNMHPNLIILQTLSKAWGMASLRLGMAFGSREIIQVLEKIKPPYNVNGATQELVYRALSKTKEKDQKVRHILSQKTVVEEALNSLEFVRHIYPSDANFLLVEMDDAKKVYQKLTEQKIIVRDRSNLPHCENCLRVTIGTSEENSKLINALKNL